MKRISSISCLIMAGLLLAGFVLPPQVALANAGEYQVAQGGDCYAIGMRHAAAEGGQLARATAEMRGNQRVCVIVVLMPAKDGQRPRRKEIVVPAG